jgi:aminopeptidase-like protein
MAVIRLLERNQRYRNNRPKGEPQLGKRGLYDGLSASDERRRHELALLWVLNLSDERHSLLDIAIEADLPFDVIERAATALAETDLLSLITQ